LRKVNTDFLAGAETVYFISAIGVTRNQNARFELRFIFVSSNRDFLRLLAGAETVYLPELTRDFFTTPFLTVYSALLWISIHE
jgi:hypothetical protein